MFEKNIITYGKHATYMRVLCKTSGQGAVEKSIANVFPTLMDVYLSGVAIGLVKGLKADEDSGEKTTIFAEQLLGRQLDFKFMYQLVILLDNSEGFSIDEKINRAFREDETKEKMELFHSYARGGIEWLYEEITRSADTNEEYMQNIREMVETLSEECKIS